MYPSSLFYNGWTFTLLQIFFGVLTWFGASKVAARVTSLLQSSNKINIWYEMNDNSNYSFLLSFILTEIPFLNYVMSIHRDSLHNSTKLLLLFFRLISPKLSENQSSNLSFIMESLLSPISNNYLIIAMLDYIYTMLKLGLSYLSI